MASEPVLVAGKWREANASSTFQAANPKQGEAIPVDFPVSTWSDCDEALDAAAKAFVEMRAMEPEKIATFLEKYADRITARGEEICKLAEQETALPYSPRLFDVELPRTAGQLRQAAAAVRFGSHAEPTIDTQANIRSYRAPLGPVAVFGPNNFPLAFNSISGGDFAAAIAAGNPVIGKANSMHPGTTKLLAEEAQAAAEETGMPAGTVQLLYRTSHEDGERLVSDPRLAATGYTGSRHAGLKLKAAADKAGKPIYLELSSVNPVLILPEAIAKRGEAIKDEFTGSCLMGTGQFCTNPGFVLLLDGPNTESFIQSVADAFGKAGAGTLLSASGVKGLKQAVETLTANGAKVLTGGEVQSDSPCTFQNTVMRVDGATFLKNPEALQTEAFGNATLFVVAADEAQAHQVIDSFEGNLTGCVYSDTEGGDDDLYNRLTPGLRQKVGRLLNDKMPTGVAVTAAMNHGGPYPATGHPGFTAVGIPGAMTRFTMLQCFDNIRDDRLPALLQDANPMKAWRRVDGEWKK